MCARLIVLALLLLPTTARAATITYTDREAFIAAAGALTLFTFDQPTLCVDPATPPPGVACHADYGFVMINKDWSYAGPMPPYVEVTPLQMSIAFDSPTMAYGFDVFGSRTLFQDPNLPIRVLGLGIVPEGLSFWGIISDDTATSLHQLQLATGSVRLDNLLVRQSAPLTIAVPEVSTWWLLLIGLIAVIIRQCPMTLGIPHGTPSLVGRCNTSCFRSDLVRLSDNLKSSHH